MYSQSHPDLCCDIFPAQSQEPTHDRPARCRPAPGLVPFQWKLDFITNKMARQNSILHIMSSITLAYGKVYLNRRDKSWSKTKTLNLKICRNPGSCNKVLNSEDVMINGQKWIKVRNIQGIVSAGFEWFGGVLGYIKIRGWGRSMIWLL